MVIWPAPHLYASFSERTKPACHQQPPMDLNFGAFTHSMLMLEHTAQRWHNSIVRISLGFWVCTLQLVQTLCGRKVECLLKALTPFDGLQVCDLQECSPLGMVCIELHAQGNTFDIRAKHLGTIAAPTVDNMLKERYDVV